MEKSTMHFENEWSTNEIWKKRKKKITLSASHRKQHAVQKKHK